VFVPPMLPQETGETAGYFEGARRGELRVQACRACGRLRHPPALMCARCQSTEREWRAVSGRGRVWSFVVAHPPLLTGFDDLAPYNVVLVELEEDRTIRVAGQLVREVGGRPDEIDPSTITIGEPVRCGFHLVGEIGFLQWLR
jgi:uncharacterized protein